MLSFDPVLCSLISTEIGLISKWLAVNLARIINYQRSMRSMKLGTVEIKAAFVNIAFG